MNLFRLQKSRKILQNFLYYKLSNQRRKRHLKVAYSIDVMFLLIIIGNILVLLKVKQLTKKTQILQAKRLNKIFTS